LNFRKLRKRENKRLETLDSANFAFAIFQEKKCIALDVRLGCRRDLIGTVLNHCRYEHTRDVTPDGSKNKKAANLGQPRQSPHDHFSLALKNGKLAVLTPK